MIASAAAWDSDAAVREAVAMKNKLDAVAIKNKLDDELRRRLAEDSDGRVRARIAYNNSTRRDLLERLANHPSEIVRALARGRLESNSWGNQ